MDSSNQLNFLRKKLSEKLAKELSITEGSWAYQRNLSDSFKQANKFILIGLYQKYGCDFMLWYPSFEFFYFWGEA